MAGNILISRRQMISVRPSHSHMHGNISARCECTFGSHPRITPPMPIPAETGLGPVAGYSGFKAFDRKAAEYAIISNRIDIGTAEILHQLPALNARHLGFRTNVWKIKDWYRLWIRRSVVRIRQPYQENQELTTTSQAHCFPKLLVGERTGTLANPSRPSRAYTHLMAWNHC